MMTVSMKFLKTLAIGASIATFVLVPMRAIHAQELPQAPVTESSTSATTVDPVVAPTPDPNQAQLDELAALRTKEQDPNTGFLTRLFLRFKINQLKNQLTIKKALQ